MNTNKLKTRDVVTIVLMSLINLVIFSLGSFLYLTPITILLMPVFYSLLQGIVFMMLGMKVQKKGMMLIYCVIQGAVGFNLPYLLMFLLAGILGEVILAKLGQGKEKSLTISYIVMQALAAIGSTVYPYALTLKDTLSRITENESLTANIQKAGSMIESWGMAVLMIVVILTAWLGARFGWMLAQKHMKKASK